MYVPKIGEVRYIAAWGHISNKLEQARETDLSFTVRYGDPLPTGRDPTPESTHAANAYPFLVNDFVWCGPAQSPTPHSEALWGRNCTMSVWLLRAYCSRMCALWQRSMQWPTELPKRPGYMRSLRAVGVAHANTEEARERQEDRKRERKKRN